MIEAKFNKSRSCRWQNDTTQRFSAC